MTKKNGYSLIEVLVATAILGVVMFGLVATFTANQKTHVMVDQVTGAQQNLRLLAEIIEKDLRMSGYLVPAHSAVCLGDSQTGPDTLYVSDSDGILTVNQLKAEDTDLLGKDFGVLVTNVSPGTPVGGSGMNLELSQRWVDVGDDSDFGVGAGVMVVDRNDPEGRVVCGTITDIVPGAGDGASLSVDFETTSLTFGTASVADIVAIPAHVYRIVVPAASGGGRYQLRRDGVLMANDVEDMQLALFFDLDDDGMMDAGEFQGDDGSAVGDGIPVAHSPSSADGRRLKQVQLNLVMATEREDPDTDGMQSRQQSTGNRDSSTLAAPDRKKRRVYRSTVRLRNV